MQAQQLRAQLVLWSTVSWESIYFTHTFPCGLFHTLPHAARIKLEDLPALPAGGEAAAADHEEGGGASLATVGPGTPQFGALPMSPATSSTGSVDAPAHQESQLASPEERAAQIVSARAPAPAPAFAAGPLKALPLAGGAAAVARGVSVGAALELPARVVPGVAAPAAQPAAQLAAFGPELGAAAPAAATPSPLAAEQTDATPAAALTAPIPRPAAPAAPALAAALAATTPAGILTHPAGSGAWDSQPKAGLPTQTPSSAASLAAASTSAPPQPPAAAPLPEPVPPPMQLPLPGPESPPPSPTAPSVAAAATVTEASRAFPFAATHVSWFIPRAPPPAAAAAEPHSPAHATIAKEVALPQPVLSPYTSSDSMPVAAALSVVQQGGEFSGSSSSSTTYQQLPAEVPSRWGTPPAARELVVSVLRATAAPLQSGRCTGIPVCPGA